MTVPNILTLLRILLTPILVWFLLDRRLGPALVVFLLAGLTDGMDGLIARVFQQKSKLGAYLDPVADKILLVTSFALLGHLDLVPDWLVIIVVSRDAIIVLGMVTLAFHQVPVEIKPSVLSKFTTLFELFTVLITLASPYVPFPQLGRTFLYWLIAVLCIVTVFQYTTRGIRIWDSHRGLDNRKI